MGQPEYIYTYITWRVSGVPMTHILFRQHEYVHTILCNLGNVWSAKLRTSSHLWYEFEGMLDKSKNKKSTAFFALPSRLRSQYDCLRVSGQWLGSQHNYASNQTTHLGAAALTDLCGDGHCNWTGFLVLGQATALCTLYSLQCQYDMHEPTLYNGPKVIRSTLYARWSCILI